MSISQQSRADLQSRIREWVDQQPSAGDVTELEEFALEVSQCVGQAVVEHGLSRVDPTMGYRKSSLPCDCGRKARFVNYRERTIGTIYGPVAIQRAYYHCKHCRRGHVPWDREQGISTLMWSPMAKCLVAETIGRLTYGEGVSLLERLLGFCIEESGSERVMDEVGGRLRGEDAELMQSYDVEQILPLVQDAPQRLYVSMDGTSAHIDGAFHEVKTGVVYEGLTGTDGIDKAGNMRYVAAQEPAEKFGHRLYVAAAQSGVAQASTVVVIGDGAEWIWNLSAHHYPGAIEIVDYWHACEHIHALAKDYYGEGDLNGKRWATDHCRWLKQRGPGTLLGAVKRMQPKTDAQREAVARETRYFTNNHQRMQYPRYRAAGLMIGSGPVEAGCKTVVGARLKRSGMRWSGRGADAVLAVRCALLSGEQNRVLRVAKAA